MPRKVFVGSENEGGVPKLTSYKTSHFLLRRLRTGFGSLFQEGIQTYHRFSGMVRRSVWVFTIQPKHSKSTCQLEVFAEPKWVFQVRSRARTPVDNPKLGGMTPATLTRRRGYIEHTLGRYHQHTLHRRMGHPGLRF